MALQTLKQQHAADQDLMYATGLPWIDPALFKPTVGDQVSLNVAHDIGNYTEPETYETKIVGKQNRIKYQISKLAVEPASQTQNRDGDVFEINSVDYEVITIEERDNHSVTCLARVKS
jgi:hypothetical protein